MTPYVKLEISETLSDVFSIHKRNPFSAKAVHSLTNSCFRHYEFHLYVHCSIRGQPLPPPQFYFRYSYNNLALLVLEPLTHFKQHIRENEGCLSQRYTQQ